MCARVRALLPALCVCMHEIRVRLVMCSCVHIWKTHNLCTRQAQWQVLQAGCSLPCVSACMKSGIGLSCIQVCMHEEREMRTNVCVHRVCHMMCAWMQSRLCQLCIHVCMYENQGTREQTMCTSCVHSQAKLSACRTLLLGRICESALYAFRYYPQWVFELV